MLKVEFYRNHFNWLKRSDRFKGFNTTSIMAMWRMYSNTIQLRCDCDQLNDWIFAI